MILQYTANGKLLLTAEYLVLRGARALVLPVRFGQQMQVSEVRDYGDQYISWKAMVQGADWFSAGFDTSLRLSATTDEQVGRRLQRLLETVREMNPGFFTPDTGYRIETHLEFDRTWGLGSSSTLISLLAQWAGVDPLDLHFRVSQGSGFDVAAATRKTPFIYQRQGAKAILTDVAIAEAITRQMYFVHLGKKQSSDTEVAGFIKGNAIPEKTIDRVSELTDAFLKSESPDEIAPVIDEHEKRLSEALGKATLKEERFPDFPYPVKSLGAWGGDFALMIYPGRTDDLRRYLETKGLFTCLHFGDLRIP